MHLFPNSHALSTLRKGTLKIAAFHGFAPFAWQDGDTARGRDINFLRRFALAYGLQLEVEFHNFDRLWEWPSRRSADIAASGISRRPENNRSVSWTRPYSEVRRTLLIRAEDSGRIQGMSDLGQLTVVPHSAAQAHAEETLSVGAQLSFVSTLEHGIEDLLLGQVDALGTGSVSAEFHAARHPGLAMVDVHALRAPELISFATRRQLVGPLDEFIAAFGSVY